MSEAAKGKFVSVETREKKRKSMLGKNKGKPCSEEHRARLREINLGKKHSEETKRKCYNAAPKGENSHLWKGGITPLNKAARETLEYKLWRTAVFERDNYTCILCGAKGELNADHIKQFAYYLELRYNTDNGRTLCVPCHKQTDTYRKRLC